MKISEQEIGWKSYIIFGKRKRLIKGNIIQQVTYLTYTRTITDMSDDTQHISDWVQTSKVTTEKIIDTYEEEVR